MKLYRSASTAQKLVVSPLTGLLIIAAGFLTACGGGAVLNKNSNTLQADVEFCGVNIIFSDKPKIVAKSDIEKILEKIGKFVKNNATGLYVDMHHLTEVAICVCQDTNEPSVMKTVISSGNEATNFNINIIDGIGRTESWDVIQSATKTQVKIIDLQSRSTCQLMQSATTPVNTISYPAFLNSVTEIKSKATKQNSNTPKDRLIQLEELRTNNLISQSEYEIKKKAILDSL
jgi:hypothetical protein